MQIFFYDGAIKGKREGQEDHKTNLKLSDGYYLYVLADGIGGHVGGKMASMAVCAAFRHYFDGHTAITDPKTELFEALMQANLAIHDIIKEKPYLTGMGSTVIALLLHEPTGKFSFISVGDSPLYCMRQKMLIRLNANHAYYEELKKDVTAGKITMKEADSHPDRHAISSAVMGNDIPFIDQRDGTMLPGEYLMLASDGIQTLDERVNGEIAQILISEKDPGEIVETLLKAVEAKNDPFQDNTTIILLYLKAEAHSLSMDPVTSRGSRLQMYQNPKILYRIIFALCFIIAGLVFFIFGKNGGETESKTAPSSPSEINADIAPDSETEVPGMEDATTDKAQKPESDDQMHLPDNAKQNADKTAVSSGKPKNNKASGQTNKKNESSVSQK